MNAPSQTAVSTVAACAEEVQTPVPLEDGVVSARPTSDTLPAATFASWVQDVARPIGDTGCGDDPRYSDRFALIKQEIDRLSGSNFEQVVQWSRELLTEEAKDLRVAGYLILGTLYCKGVGELPDAIEAYRLILDKFWDGCFPLRDSARSQAFAWLNSDRMEGFIQQQNGDGLAISDLQRLQQGLDGLNQLARQRFGADAPQWTRLHAWVDSLLKERLAERAKREKEQREQDERMRSAASADAPMTEDRAGELVTKLVSFYREKGERPRALALSRAYRWGGLKTPPNEGGVTRIPPLRPTAFTEMQALHAGGAGHEQMFQFCESLFMEPGGQWSMDVQRATHAALVGLGDTSSVQVLEAAIRGLLRRCPELPDLCYDGAAVFAGEDTKEWLQTLSVDGDDGGGRGDAPTDQETQAVVKNAAKAAGAGKLIAGLAVLRDLPEKNGRQRFIKRLEEARLCIRTKHTDMALPILEALEEEMTKTDLARWEPTLALAVWRLHTQAIKQELPKADSTHQHELSARLKAINAAVCMTDLHEAARMNRPAKAKGATNG